LKIIEKYRKISKISKCRYSLDTRYFDIFRYQISIFRYFFDTRFRCFEIISIFTFDSWVRSRLFFSILEFDSIIFFDYLVQSRYYRGKNTKYRTSKISDPSLLIISQFTLFKKNLNSDRNRQYRYWSEVLSRHPKNNWRNSGLIHALKILKGRDLQLFFGAWGFKMNYLRTIMRLLSLKTTRKTNFFNQFMLKFPNGFKKIRTDFKYPWELQAQSNYEVFSRRVYNILYWYRRKSFWNDSRVLKKARK